MRIRKRWAVSLCGAAAGLLAGCGTIDMSGSGGNPFDISKLRRVYINDQAANDSLPDAFLSEGVVMVLQPGKSYNLQVNSPFASNRMIWNLYANGSLQSLGAVTAAADSGGQVFTVKSGYSSASIFVGQLASASGSAAAPPFGHVAITNLNPVPATALAVHLFLVGSLYGLSDTAAEDAYAKVFLDTLTGIYAAYGVAIHGSFELVNPTSAPMEVSFGTNFTQLPGQRIPNSVPMYLVDNITQSSSAASGTILGFAPREAVDMVSDPASRVVLNARAGDPVQLATTAAHEMGHFFGLRHPTATQLDLDADDDLSNFDDGLQDTPVCIGLSKRAAGTVEAMGPEGRPYCLFMTGVSCPASCDLTNLMFPYNCSDSTNSQRVLTPDQQAFLRRNMGLLEGL